MTSPTRDETIRALIGWITQQRETYERQIELMEAGRMRTSENSGAGMVDVTAKNVERSKEVVAELDRLLIDYESAEIAP